MHVLKIQGFALSPSQNSRHGLGAGDQIVGYTGSGKYTGERLCDLAARANISIEDFAYDLIFSGAGRSCRYFSLAG